MIAEIEQRRPAAERPAAPRYRRLPRGPSGLAREQIGRNQRARLYGGMVDSVVRRGYEATTVADVIACAGVSRRAFYEHFRDKDHCLVATHGSIVGRAHQQMVAALGSDHGFANRLYAACRSFFDDVRTHPKGAHLVLVDSLGIAPGARERLTLTNVAFERLIYTGLRGGWRHGELPRLTPRAIVGGVRHVAFTRVRENRVHELETLAEEVLDWIESYRLTREQMPTLRRDAGAPSQRHAPFLHREDARARILLATVRLIQELGYAEVTDSQLAKTARLPTQALHKQFPNKQACFLAAIDAFVAEALESARARMSNLGAWPAAVCEAVISYVEHLAAHRALLRLSFVDLFDVGPATVWQMTRSVEQLVALLTDAGPAPRRAPLVVREAITGALWATIFTCAACDHPCELAPLAGQLTFIVLAPYIGPAAAAHELFAGQRRHAAQLC